VSATLNTSAQNISTGHGKPAVYVYYFHPSERCPIDLTIEDNTRQTVQANFAKNLKDGSLKLLVLNTDEKANAKIAAGFDINAQALYIVKTVKGKEARTDLTEFAFSTSQGNPSKFKSRLKDEITEALK
jgi:hypothetical protein